MAEVDALLSKMEGVTGLMAQLMYGTGMRLTECVSLRVKDLDLELQQVLVRQGKGGRDRVTMLPQVPIPSLRGQLIASRAVFECDRLNEVPGVERRAHPPPERPAARTTLRSSPSSPEVQGP